MARVQCVGFDFTIVKFVSNVNTLDIIKDFLVSQSVIKYAVHCTSCNLVCTVGTFREKCVVNYFDAAE